MRGVYEASISISSVSAAKTLVYLTAPSNKVVEVLRAAVTNKSNETNEQLECTLQLVTTLGTPTKTDITPAKTEQGDQAAGSTVAGNVTASEPTYTSGVEVGRKGFPSLGGYEYVPMPEERQVIAGGATWGLRMLSTPTAFDAVVELVFREIG